MVAELTLNRGEYAEYEAAVREIQLAATALRHELLQLADEDAVAFEGVVLARRLPRDTDQQRAVRRERIQQATAEATRVPLRTAQAAAQVLDLAGRIAPIGNRHAISDAGVAADLAAAAVRGALLNVRINLPGLPAGPVRDDAARQLARLESRAADDEGRARAAVLARIGG
jgi:formiminotetrahydrofolate cyclodeaminase